MRKGDVNQTFKFNCWGGPGWRGWTFQSEVVSEQFEGGWHLEGGSPFKGGAGEVGMPRIEGNSGQTSISSFPQISQPLPRGGGVNIFCTPPPCLALGQVLLDSI